MQFISLFKKKKVKPVLNESDLNDAFKTINSWAKQLIKIENEQNVRRMEVSNLDYDFLHTLGQSLYFMNLYNALLIKLINSQMVMSPGYDEVLRFVRYFNSLTTSKVKHFFFRESPIVNVNNNDIDYNWEIYFNAKQIIDNISDEGHLNSTKKHVYKYMMHSSLVYSFLYNSITNKGIFLHFEDDADIAYENFSELKELYLSNIESIKTELDMRLFADKFYILYFNYYLSRSGVVIDETLPVSSLYAKFYDFFKSNEHFALEKYIYRLGEIIWKFDGMLQDDDEFMRTEDKLKRDNELIPVFSAFLKNYFDLFKSKKTYSQPKYLELFSLESKFIEKTYSIVFRERTRGDVYKIFDEMKSLPIKTMPFANSPKARIDVNSIVSQCRALGEQGFRIDSLLTILKKEDLLGLLALLYKYFSNTSLLDDRTEFVGIYKSGVFIAHIVNLLSKRNKPIWLFKTKPYVATHPVHVEDINNGKSDYSKIFVFDDVLKTGFTFFMYENYLSRNLSKKDLSLNLYTLSCFEQYKRIDSLYASSHNSLLHLNDDLIPVNENVINALNNNLGFSYALPICGIEEAQNIIRQLVVDGRVDLTFVLTNTKACLGICNLFASIIINRFGPSVSNFGLFSPSADGEVLALMTGLMLRLRGKSVCFLRNAMNKSLKKVCIDMSLITGSTLSLAVRNYSGPSGAALNSFDLMLTLVMAKRLVDNVKFKTIFEVDL